MEVDQTFVAAILTIIGYSINDTVVVFDRIRETIHLYPKRDRYQVINDALNSTLCRTFNTSFTTLVVVLCIFILGGSIDPKLLRSPSCSVSSSVPIQPCSLQLLSLMKFRNIN